MDARIYNIHLQMVTKLCPHKIPPDKATYSSLRTERTFLELITPPSLRLHHVPDPYSQINSHGHSQSNAHIKHEAVTQDETFTQMPKLVIVDFSEQMYRSPGPLAITKLLQKIPSNREITSNEKSLPGSSTSDMHLLDCNPHCSSHRRTAGLLGHISPVVHALSGRTLPDLPARCPLADYFNKSTATPKKLPSHSPTGLIFQ